MGYLTFSERQNAVLIFMILFKKWKIFRNIIIIKIYKIPW